MDDDDEFGDLYTDVLTPFATSISIPQPQSQPQSTSFTIDLNAHTASDDDDDDDDVVIPDSVKPDEEVAPISTAASSGSRLNLNLEADKTEVLGLGLAVAESGGFEDPNSLDESAIDIVVDEIDDGREDKGDVLVDKNEGLVEFDIEEGNNTGIGDEAEGDDWDSDSEDDLQIVLNNDHDLINMDRIGADDDDEDEDDPLVILDNGDPNHHQGMDDRDWVEDNQGGDGERKDLVDGVAKINGGLSQASKIPFNNHMYHPFHSQFKYVRPGATPMPGAPPVGPGGAPGQQVRPGVNMGGRGRGEWRPSLTGMQKNFNSGGFGGTGGRAFGSGPEFTLPSHKTIFEVDIESFEEKPWKLQGIEISDFFNFGMNEETWKDYCKQLEQLRLEGTMQSRIRVYESGRTEQDYDPDMPPELAAATGIHEVPTENPNISKSEAAGQIDLTSDSRSRQQLPTGRAIQVETGYGERLPSIDTRAPRLRDSDAIIEIVLQGSTDDDETTPANDTSAGVDENEPLKNLSGGLDVEEDPAEEDTEENIESLPQQSSPYNSNDENDNRKREFSGRKPQFKNLVHETIMPEQADQHHNSPFLPEIPPQFRPHPRAQHTQFSGSHSNFSYDESRRTKGRMRDRSPNLGPIAQDKRFPDNQREDSVESFDTKNRNTTATPPRLSDNKDDIGVPEAKSLVAEREEQPATFDTDNSLKDENRKRSSKKPRLGSDDVRSSDNSRDDEEQRRSARRSDDHHKIKVRDERRQLAPPPPPPPPHHHHHRSNNIKSSRDNTNTTRHSHMKSDSNNNNPDVIWQRKDERQHRSKEPTGSRHVDNGNWPGSRHMDREDSVKVRESTSRRKREREENNVVLDHHLHNNNYNNKKESLDQRRRSDDQRSARHKEETVWRVREREEIPYKRESARSGRSNNDNNNDYHVKEERRSRQERESNRTAVNASDNNQKVHHEKKHRESSSTRKSNKESEGDTSRRNPQEDSSSAAASRRNLQEDHGSERVKSRGTVHELRKHKEDASSDEEQQDSRRGRSKLERWTSHKERDFTLTAKSSSSSALNIKPIDGHKSSKTTQESSKTATEATAGPDAKSDGNADEDNDNDNNDNKHLDTVAKLKKRSERFKLPMPSEKEAIAVIKKMENEPLLPAAATQTETSVDFSEVKHERPPRKRRWTSNQ
jgi:hypothetical protein